MSVYLTYRLRNGKKHGPYGMSGNQYLGAVTVQDQDVFLNSNGEFVGQLTRRSGIPKKEVSELPFTNIESAIRSLFYIVGLTHQHIDDIKFELQPQFSGEAIDAAILNLVRKGILERVCPGNYKMVI